MTQDTPEPIRLALDVADLALADRLVAAFADLAGIRLVHASEMPDAVLVCPARDGSPTVASDLLTPREIAVLGLLAEGASNKVIARRLGISVHTAKFHVSSVLNKLDAIGRTDAVAQAARIGVIHL